MNKLVEYLAENYHPGGNSYRVVSVQEVMEGSDLTVEEIHYNAMDAYKRKYLVLSRLRVKGNRYGVDMMIPGDIDHLAITREGIKWYEEHRKNV
jgi:hypothetical protein